METNASAQLFTIRSNAKPDRLPQLLLGLIIVVLFFIANVQVERFAPIIGISPQLLSHIYAALFFLNLIGLFYALWDDFCDYLHKNRKELLLSLKIALGFFIVLSLLILPFDPGTFALCRKLGCNYTAMTLSPFTEGDECFFRRLLLPAIAYYTGLKGTLYPILTLSSTLVLLTLTIQFLRASIDLMPASNPRQGLLTLLGITTCGFMMIGFLRPGYCDQLAFTWILLLFLVPMRTQARIACIALALITHDGVVGPLVPLILFCFPRAEKKIGVGLIALFIFSFAVGYGFHISQALELHHTIGPRSEIYDFIDYPLVILLGIFGAYKFFWLAIFAVTLELLRSGRYKLLLTYGALMFSFIPLIFIAWDTTRLTNFSFIGLLMTLLFIYHDGAPLMLKLRRAIPLIALISLITPTYTIMLYNIHHATSADENGRMPAMPEAGLYHFISEYLPINLPAANIIAK